MTTRQKTAPAPVYLSGWCGTGEHDRCRGTYASAECRCSCHAPSGPAPDLEVASDAPSPQLLVPVDAVGDSCPTCGQDVPRG